MQKQKKTNSVPTKEETELKKTVVEGSQIHCLREIQLFGDKKKSICTLCFIVVQQMQSNIEFIEIVEVQEDIVRIKH